MSEWYISICEDEDFWPDAWLNGCPAFNDPDECGLGVNLLEKYGTDFSCTYAVILKALVAASPEALSIIEAACGLLVRRTNEA